MISPLETRLLLEYFDKIDATAVSVMAIKKPYGEEAITQRLATLMDMSDCESIGFVGNYEQLTHGLREAGTPFEVTHSVVTHQYSKHLEGAAHQSDLGIIVNYLDPAGDSWTTCIGLQAKALKPKKGTFAEYLPGSSFSSFDAAQHHRISQVNTTVGDPFVNYLLYCPRLEDVDEGSRSALVGLRNRATGEFIFDFTLGLELRDELLKARPKYGCRLHAE